MRKTNQTASVKTMVDSTESASTNQLLAFSNAMEWDLGEPKPPLGSRKPVERSEVHQPVFAFHGPVSILGPKTAEMLAI